ncbi:LuxR C-terminal-related transcriptional regulator [Emcibacter sp.]|uniref:LuxR C-terminal-related transcriptional regulator n=1 Tax=Emcibacter sp. TaxID=1979954 RepID=UPI002AA8DCB1|nr:LuxR C-terminal-related transcriptional regulator [Emcibacter sp.]
MNTDLIITKLFPPGNRASRVRRPHLENLLDREGLRRVTVVSAGAGFGKTTLMAEWYHLLKGQKMATAWVSLDSRDQDQGQFLNYLIEALRIAGAVDGKSAESILQNKLENRFFSALGALINELAAGQQEAVLFLDDYHLADGPDISLLMESFINLAPPNFHFVISSRTKPLLPIATLKVHDQILILPEHDLRFSEGETAEFMRGKQGLDISEESLHRLISSTEGWVAGLQLVSLALRDKHLEENFLRQFSGSSRDVVEFLTANVFAMQPERLQKFMMSTAVLERFNAEVAEVLTGDENAQTTLEYLEDNNLFIVPLDQSRGWYRYHQLYREFLLAQLKRLHREEIPVLKRKAAQWFADSGLLVEAVSLAHESGDYDYLAELVEIHADNIRRRGHMPLMLDWCKKIPEDIARTRPQIPIYEGYALFHMRRPIEAAGAAYRVEKAIAEAEKRGIFSPEKLNRWRQDIKVIKTGVAIAADDVVQAEKLASVPLEIGAGNADFMIGAMNNMLGYACTSLNKFDKARAALERAREAHTRVRSVYGVVYADCFTGILEMAQGDLQKAYDCFVHAEQTAAGDNLPNSPAIAVSRLYQGLVFYEWGRLDEALDLITGNIELVEECGQAEAPIMGYAILARLYRTRGEGEKIYEPIEAAHRICQQDKLHRLHVLTEYEYVQQLILDDKLPEARERASRVGIDVRSLEDDLKIENWDRIKCVRSLTKARLLLALNEADRATELLLHLEKLAETVGRRRRLLEIKLLLARAFALVNDRDRAIVFLSQALELSRTEKYIRLFVDEGPEIAGLLKTCLRNGSAEAGNGLQGYIVQLLEAFGQPQQQPATSEAGISQAIRRPVSRPENSGHLILEPLSERERDVLRLLSRGYSNQKIGQDLSIAENTVKWHIKNLFEKLGVKNRTSAVLAAQDLGLL